MQNISPTITGFLILLNGVTLAWFDGNNKNQKGHELCARPSRMLNSYLRLLGRRQAESLTGEVSADDYVSARAHFGETNGPGLTEDANNDGLVVVDD